MRPKPDTPNQNTTEYLESLRVQILEHLSQVTAAPSVAFHERAPDGIPEGGVKEESMSQGSGRPSMRLWDGELDPEGDVEPRARGIRVDTSYRDMDEGLTWSPTGSMRRPGSGDARSPRPNMLRAKEQAAPGEAHG